MKKNYLAFVCLFVATMFTVSCSRGDKMKGLLEKIPDNSDVVFVGNLKTIVESSGGSLEEGKIKLPSNIMEAFPNDVAGKLDDANNFMKKSGIDLDAFAMTVGYDDNNPVLLFALTDKEQFVNSIEKEGFKESSVESDAVFYVKTEDDYYGQFSSYIAVDGSYAYWIDKVWEGSDFKPLQTIQNMINAAAEKNLSDTEYGKYAIGGNAGGLVLSWPDELKEELLRSGLPSEALSVYDGYLCMRGNLESDECSVDIKMFGEDGKEIDNSIFSKFIDISSTVSSDALAMLGKDEFMFYAVSIKDFNWDEYTDMMSDVAQLSRSDRAQLNAMKSYLEKIDGTVAFGMGLTNGLESISNLEANHDIMSQFSTTMVVETKNGDAGQIVSDLKGLLETSGIPFNEDETGFSIDMANMGTPGSVYVKAHGNMIVMSNNNISENNGNTLIDNGDFTKYLAVFCIGLDKESKLMKDLDIDNDVKFGIYCKPETMDVSIKLEMDGNSDAGIIARFADMIIGIRSHVDRI